MSFFRSFDQAFASTCLQSLGWAVVGGAMLAGVRVHGSDKVDFNADVRPIFNQHCVACHGGVKQAGDLSFVRGADADYIIEPGAPDESILIDRVTSTDPDMRMPPADHGKPLSEEDVSTLRDWVTLGGEWGQHWAFVPPTSQDPPAVKDEGWIRSPIDAFVLPRIEQAGLEPAPAAEPERWLRRVSLDLTGLPPSLAQRREFLQAVEQDREAAYVAAVDRLLNAPQFGERWASVWLDVVRYADSKGLGIDGRRTIWKYRDWVIRAFNSDMPFDEFTIKQLAGDLLPEPSIDDMLATACHRLTQTCEEGGTDDEMFRIEAVIDRVNTTMLAWQGLTFGCVQCHSHPYDPIEHQEYYEFLAFFNNTADSDLENEEPRLRVPLDQAQSVLARDLDRRIDDLETQQWQRSSELLTKPNTHWEPLQDFAASTNNTTRVVRDEVDGFAEVQTRGTVAKHTTVVVDAALPDALQTLTAIRFTGLPKDEAQAYKDSEWGFVISHFKAELLRGDESTELKIVDVVGDERVGLMDPRQSLNAKSNDGFGAYSRIHYPRSGVFVLETPIELTPGSRLRVSLKQNVFALGAFPLVAHRGRLEVTDSVAFHNWYTATESSQQRGLLAELQKERQSIAAVQIPVMRERPSGLARPTFVFDRGNFLSKTTPVEADTPDFLPELGEQRRDRLAMARWLASPENPLTARVAVNRFWAQVFGRGLVRTQEDFGSSGDAPTHPLLLDDLSARFSGEMGWSVKTLLRELVLSATYRQSSAVTPALLAADPDNRWLARGPRHRLPAETIRDQALAVSGLLSDTQFGPPVHPPIPQGVWQPFQGGDKWSTPEKGDPDRYRRTIYTYTKRTIQFPMLASFDAPTREFCSPRRLLSNTPLQALMTLNDTTFVEASQALAARMQHHADKPRQQIRHGFLLATGRQPTAAELGPLLALYRQRAAELLESADSETDAADGDAVADTPPVALTAVATVLLNLDEVLNK